MIFAMLLSVAERNHQLAVAEREANVKGFTENLKTAKAEAIKEFAYRLKNIPRSYVYKWEIDDVKKEMDGDDDV